MKLYWVAAAITLAPGTAWGQTISPFGSVDLASDHRERGLSMTGGKTSIRGQVGLDAANGLSADVTAATLRDAVRHGGADLGLDTTLSYRLDRGLFLFDAGVIVRLFPGTAGNLDYAELFGGGALLLGPAELGLTANYAPRQNAIGGDNLYIRARARMALPGTPVSLSGHLGRSAGDTRDPVKAARLRPGGRYDDWSVGADYALGSISLGLAYSDTNHSGAYSLSRFADARNSGTTLNGRVSLSF